MHEHYLHVLVRLHRVHAIHLLVKLLKKLYGDLLVIFYNVYPPIYNFGTLVLYIELYNLLKQSIVLVDESLFNLGSFGLLNIQAKTRLADTKLIIDLGILFLF
jgi:hypothetical protein